MWLFLIFYIIKFTRINMAVGNWIHVPNTDTFSYYRLLNNRDINNCSIIISNKNSRYT